jgi:GNAT superfamily N-acetyltransferase
VFPVERLAQMGGERTVAGWREVIVTPSKRTHTLVATRNREVLGFAHLGGARDEPETVGELYAIYVHPDVWGHGVGRALMAESLDRFHEEGFTEAILWVLEDNPRTRTFYELAGWHADGAFKDEEWLNTLVREVRYRITLGPTT